MKLSLCLLIFDGTEKKNFQERVLHVCNMCACVLFICTRKVFQVKLAAGTCGAIRKTENNTSLCMLLSVFFAHSFFFFIVSMGSSLRKKS